MPRKKTDRKQAEKFVSKVSDKMVVAQFLELYPAKNLQAMFTASPEYKSKVLACIRAVMELEEINREIEDVRAKQGVPASLVNIGPRGGKTLTPLERSRRTKENQVLRKYRSVRQSQEWPIFIGVKGKQSLLSAMSRMEGPHPEATPRLPRYGVGGTEKKRKKAKKSPSRRESGRGPRRRDIMEGSADPRFIGSDLTHDLASSADKSPKNPPITAEGIARAIREFEAVPQRRRLLPHYGMAFQITLVVLKSREKELKFMFSLQINANMRLKMLERIARLIEFLRSLFW